MRAARRHNLVAFAKDTGQRAWSVAHSKTSDYATPALATLGGVPQILVLANDQVLGVRPEDGALLWSQPHGLDRRGAAAPRWCCPAIAC